MRDLSRRNMLGVAAASVAAGIGLVKGGALAHGASEKTVARADPKPPKGSATAPPLRTMTLNEFQALDASEVEHVLSILDCTTFSCCHGRVREETGIWIPELVPVFDKLDAMRQGTKR